VDRALGAGGLALLKGAPRQPSVGVGEQFLAFGTESLRGFVVVVAKAADHGLHSAGFALLAAGGEVVLHRIQASKCGWAGTFGKFITFLVTEGQKKCNHNDNKRPSLLCAAHSGENRKETGTAGRRDRKDTAEFFVVATGQENEHR
jgi:hypothetical protein